MASVCVTDTALRECALMVEARLVSFVVPCSYVNCVGSTGSQECAECIPRRYTLNWMMSSVVKGNDRLVVASVFPQKWEDVYVHNAVLCARCVVYTFGVCIYSYPFVSK